MPGRLWIDEELRLLRECRTPDDCARLAPTIDRTPCAVNMKRLREGYIMHARRPWTPEEDAALFAVDWRRGSAKLFAAKLGRSVVSVRLRRRRQLARRAMMAPDRSMG